MLNITSVFIKIITKKKHLLLNLKADVSLGYEVVVIQ